MGIKEVELLESIERSRRLWVDLFLNLIERQFPEAVKVLEVDYKWLAGGECSKIIIKKEIDYMKLPKNLRFVV